MTLTVRSILTGLGLGFCLYFVARGLWWTEQPLIPPLLVGALALYLVTMVAAMLIDGPDEGRMPLWLASLTIVAVVAVPAMASLALTREAREAPFATWYIGATGLLCVVCVVKHRPIFGWAGLGVLTLSAMTWLGPGDAFRLGLVGSIVWMLTSQLLAWMWARAMRDTERMADIEQQVAAWHATGRVRRQARRMRVRYALSVAGPVLSRVIATGGLLDEGERLQARLAEGRLRDELRGEGLLNDAVRGTIEAARRGGASVTVLDEGGLEGIDEVRRDEIRAELAEILGDAGQMRVIVRSAQHPEIAVTIVGRDASGEDSDHDAVGLWREIPRMREDGGHE